MLAYAMDNPAPATIVLISGDGDFVHAVSLLRLRRYYVVIIAPTQNNMHLSMKHQASEVYDWCSDIIPTPPRAGDTSLNPRNGHGMSRASMSPATISTARALRSTAAPFYPGSPTVIRDRGNRVQHQQRPSDPDNGEGPDRPVRMYDSVAAGFTFGSFYANISAPCTVSFLVTLRLLTVVLNVSAAPGYFQGTETRPLGQQLSVRVASKIEFLCRQFVFANMCLGPARRFPHITQYFTYTTSCIHR